MKVCHMTSAHSGEDVRIFYKECISLANAGYDVYLVGSGDSYDKNGVHIVGVGSISGNRFQRMTKGARKVYEAALALDCELYHFHDPELLPYGLKLKKIGKKVIFDSHENTVEQIKEKQWIPSIVRKPVYTVFDWYQKRVCKKLDAIISVTPHICDYFKECNTNTYMVTNYPVLHPLCENTNKESGTLCFAGGISAQWNHEKIIEAIETIDHCKYLLFGRGEGEYFNNLKKMPAWEKVDYRGVVPHDTIHSLLESCQIGVSVLSYNHNTGFKTGTMGNTKIFEQMMAGLPVICTDFDLWKRIINQYECGIFVNPNDIQEITNAIKFLIDNPDLSAKMGKNGRHAIEVEFNWEMEEKKLLEIYRIIRLN